MRYILLILFFVMLATQALGLDLSLAPGLSVKNAFLYLVGLSIIVQTAIARNRRIELLPVLVPFGLLGLYAGFTWLAIVLALNYPGYSAFEALITLKTKLGDHFLILLVFFYGVLNYKDALWLLKALIWVIIFGNVITVMDALNMPDLGIVAHRDDGRIQGLTGGSNEFGAFLTFFLPAILALLWCESGGKRPLAILGVVATLLALLLTASRGAFVGTLVGSVLATVYLRKYVPVRMVAGGAVAVLVFCVVAVVVISTTEFSTLLDERIAQGVGTGDQHTISSGRTTIWLGALRQMADAPLTFLTGFGWDAYYQTGFYRLAMHSTYIDYLFHTGVLGLTLFIATVGNALAIVRRALADTKTEAAPYFIGFVFGMTGLLVAMVFNNLEVPALYAWAFAGVVLRLSVATTSSKAVSLSRSYGLSPKIVQSRQGVAIDNRGV